MSDLDPFTRGWMQGVADAGARLVGLVAAELGADHPVVDRMVLRLGGLPVPAQDDMPPSGPDEPR